MEPKTGTIQSYDGLDLFYRIWEPTEPPHSIIVFFHGGGGHSGQPTYTHFTRYFVENGYALYGLDQRGHGRSEGDKYHIESMADIRRDMGVFLDFARDQNVGKPVFALGQSMGGLFVLDYCLQHPDSVTGAVSVAPGLNLEGIPAVVRGIFRLFSRIAPKRLMKVRGVDLNGATRDAAEAQRITTDPLTNLSSTPRTVIQIMETIARAHENAPNFQTPLLMIHGDADPISPSKGSKTFFDAVTLQDKTLDLIPGGYHQPFIDINRDEVFANLDQWFRKRAG